MKEGSSILTRFGANLAFASILFVLTACTESSREGRAFGTFGAALDAQSSGEFDLQAYPTEFTDVVGTVKMACGTVRCLAAYDRSFGSGVEHALMTRLDPVTGANDLPRLRLGSGEHVASVAARGDEFLVITEKTSAPNAGVHFRRIRGTDGAVLADDPGPRLPPGVPVKIAASSTTWLLAYEGPNSGETVTYVYDAEFELLGGPSTISDFYPSQSRFIVGQDQFLLSSYGKIVRISAVTGEALDTTPVDWGKYASINAEGVYQDGSYLFAWGGQEVKSARVNASTLSLYNPPDDFKQVPAFQSVYTNAPNTTPVSSTLSSLDIIAGRPVAHWRSGNYVYGLAVDATSGYRPSGDTGTPRAMLFHNGTYDLFPVSLNTVALVNDAYYVLAPTVTSGQYPDFDNVLRPLNTTTYARTTPNVASNGTGFLAVWAQSRPEDSAWMVLASRVDPETGAYLDDPPLMLGIGDDPRVASNGTSYLVQWDTGSRSERRLVNANGTLGEVITSAFRGRGQLVWNGSRFIYATGTAFVRFEPGGTSIGAESETGNPAGFTGSFATDMVVAVDTTPEPALRTALFVGEQPQANPTVTDIQGIRLRVQSGNIVSPVTTIFTAHDHPLVASNGTQALVIARQQNGTIWSGVLVDISTGEVLEETRRELFEVDGYGSVAGALFDGSAFLVQLRHTRADTYPVTTYVYRFDNALNPMGAEFPAAGTDVTFVGDWGADKPWAVNNAGRVLLVARTADVDRLGYAVKARFLDFSGAEIQIPSATPTTSPPSGVTQATNDSPSLDASDASSADPMTSTSTPLGAPDAGPISAPDVGSTFALAPGATSTAAAWSESAVEASFDAATTPTSGEGGSTPDSSASGALARVDAGADNRTDAGADTVDSPPQSDAGTANRPRADAGSVTQANTEAGCSCKVGTTSSAPPSAWWLGLVMLGFWRRRVTSNMRASAVLLLAASSCASEKKDPACQGFEGCACYGNRTCEPGLACYSNYCVEPLIGPDAAVVRDAASALADARSNGMPSDVSASKSQADPESIIADSGTTSPPTHGDDATTNEPLPSTTPGSVRDAGESPGESSTTATLTDAMESTESVETSSLQTDPSSIATSSSTSSIATSATTTTTNVSSGETVVEAAVCEQKLVSPPPVNPSHTVEYNRFGGAVSLSGDTLAVGSGDDELGNSVGAVYIYVKGSDAWELQAKVLPQLDDGTFVTVQNAQFGTVLSLEGDTLAVGSPAANPLGSFSGAVYTYVRSGNSWLPQGRIIAQLPGGELNGASGDRFGASVSLSGDTLAIGATDNQNAGHNDGAVYIYVRESNTWSPQAKLLPQLPNGDPDPASGDRFGAALSLDGNALAVGASNADGHEIVTGAVYVYSRSDQIWTFDTRVLAQLPDGTPDDEQWDEFGTAVSLSGETLVVGARRESEQANSAGAVYVYGRDVLDFVPRAKLFAQNSDASLDTAPSAEFGWAISLSNDNLFVGATGDDVRGDDFGMVYSYERQNDAWYPKGKIVAQTADGMPDALAGDHFGWALSASSGLLAIGAPDADIVRTASGAVYLYAF